MQKMKAAGPLKARWPFGAGFLSGGLFHGLVLFEVFVVFVFFK